MESDRRERASARHSPENSVGAAGVVARLATRGCRFPPKPTLIGNGETCAAIRGEFSARNRLLRPIHERSKGEKVAAMKKLASCHRRIEAKSSFPVQVLPNTMRANPPYTTTAAFQKIGALENRTTTRIVAFQANPKTAMTRRARGESRSISGDLSPSSSPRRRRDSSCDNGLLRNHHNVSS